MMFYSKVQYIFLVFVSYYFRVIYLFIAVYSSSPFSLKFVVISCLLFFSYWLSIFVCLFIYIRVYLFIHI